MRCAHGDPDGRLPRVRRSGAVRSAVVPDVRLADRLGRGRSRSRGEWRAGVAAPGPRCDQPRAIGRAPGIVWRPCREPGHGPCLPATAQRVGRRAPGRGRTAAAARTCRGPYAVPPPGANEGRRWRAADRRSQLAGAAGGSRPRRSEWPPAGRRGADERIARSASRYQLIASGARPTIRQPPGRGRGLAAEPAVRCYRCRRRRRAARADVAASAGWRVSAAVRGLRGEDAAGSDGRRAARGAGDGRD